MMNEYFKKSIPQNKNSEIKRGRKFVSYLAHINEDFTEFIFTSNEYRPMAVVKFDYHNNTKVLYKLRSYDTLAEMRDLYMFLYAFVYEKYFEKWNEMEEIDYREI